MKRTILMICTALALPAVLSAIAVSATLNVPSQHPTIQDAIDAATHWDTVLVAPGTYVENIDFLGKLITVRSSAGPQLTTIDGGSPLDPNRASVVIFDSGESSDSVLDGFTLTNGSGTFWPPTQIFAGGGIWCMETSPTIINNIIINNSAEAGGGIAMKDGGPTISDNTITGNTADAGGGIVIEGWDPDNFCSPTITNNTITDNIATSLDFGGGGIWCGVRSAPVITHNILANNTGAIGGGMFCHYLTVLIIDALVVDMDAPPAGPSLAPFVLYVWIGEPTETTITPHPKNLGHMCFPSPVTGGLPMPKKIWNNIGKYGVLGEPSYPSSPAPSVVFSKPSGLNNPLSVTFQGIILDAASVADKPASITNAVILRIQ